MLRVNTNLSQKVTYNSDYAIILKYINSSAEQGLLHPAYENNNNSIELHLCQYNDRLLIRGFFNLKTTFNVTDYPGWSIKIPTPNSFAYAVKLLQFTQFKEIYEIDFDKTPYVFYDNIKVVEFMKNQWKIDNPATFTLSLDNDFNLYVMIGEGQTYSVPMTYGEYTDFLFQTYSKRLVVLKKKFKSSTSKRYLTPNFINKLMKGGRKYA